MKFGSVAVSGLDLWYADYAGNANSNDHVIGNQQITRGMFAISIETFSLNRVKHSDVVDGTSNTILYWEGRYEETPKMFLWGTGALGH